MKKILLMLSLVLVSLSGFAQTVAPDATKPYLIFDASYQLASVGTPTSTNVAIYYSNTSATVSKAVQFRFWYDKSVFNAPTLTYVGGEPANYMSSSTNETEGYVTVAWVYTGSNTSFNIANGAMFNVAFTFKSTYATGPVTNMSFTGISTFPAYATTAAAADTTLGLQNYGGAFIAPAFQYAATFLNSPSNPASDIAVILQKSSDGNTWTDIMTANTNVDGVASFTTNIDQVYWHLRVKVAPGINATSALSTADANMISEIVAGNVTPTGTQFYTGNPNQSTSGITVSDSYQVFSRLAQGATSYPANPDVLFFTEAEYNQISTASTNLSATIPGQATFQSAYINNTTSGNYYMLILGDVNGTGLN